MKMNFTRAVAPEAFGSRGLNHMVPIKDKSKLQIIIRAAACLVLGAGLFGLGYWQGHRAQRPETNALANRGISSGWDNDPARLNPAHPPIPANATPEMKEFLENQATLSDKMEQLRSKAPNGALTPQAFAQFRQQNSDLLKRQSQLAQIIAQQQNNNTLVAPSQPQSPPHVSAQLQAYLAARDKLMRDQIAFMNQHAADSLTIRQAAMQQWRKQNAARFQQLQQLAQALTPSQATSIK